MESTYRVEWFPGMTLEMMELLVIQSALFAHGGNRSKTASSLGVCVRTVTNKIRDMRQRGMEVPPAPEPYWGTHEVQGA